MTEPKPSLTTQKSNRESGLYGVAQSLAAGAKACRAKVPNAAERTKLYHKAIKQCMDGHDGTLSSWMWMDKAMGLDCDGGPADDVQLMDCLYQAILYHKDQIPLQRLEKTASLAVLAFAATGKPFEPYTNLLVKEHAETADCYKDDECKPEKKKLPAERMMSRDVMSLAGTNATPKPTTTTPTTQDSGCCVVL